MNPTPPATEPLCIPPVTPVGERSVDCDDGFASLCLAAVRDFTITKEWKLVEQRLTYSDVWGLIWRGEFERPPRPGDYNVNSVFICWRTANGTLQMTLAISESRRAP